MSQIFISQSLYDIYRYRLLELDFYWFVFVDLDFEIYIYIYIHRLDWVFWNHFSCIVSKDFLVLDRK